MSPTLEKHHHGAETPRSYDSKTDLESETASDLFPASVFDDPQLRKFYEPPDKYESKHRFDVNARWTKEEERQVLRKVDLKVCLFVCICFAALQLDRGNISQAISDNMLDDIGVTTNDYNTGQTIFLCSFLAMELPSQLISKAIGVDRWIPFQMVAWSVVAISQYAIKNKTGFWVTRALLGALEGGFIPDMILYLSYWYTAKELAIRLSFFWVSYTTTTIIGSFIAAGIEGCLTLAVGVFAVFWMPPSPTETASWFRGKTGWFSEQEETIIVMRVLRDDPTKSSMHNREHIGWRDLWKSFADFDHIPIYMLGLTTYIAPHTINAYFTLTLKSLGFSTFHTNLLVIPSQVLFIINNLGLTFLSRALNERTLIASLGSWWQFVLMVAIVLVPDSTGVWGKYALLTLILGYPYAHPIIVSWNSRNSGSVRTRSVSASVYNMSVQISSIIASNIYRADDKPYYHRGNKILLALVIVNLFLFALTKLYLLQRNRQRRRAWEGLSAEEREVYLSDTKDEGNRRLDFQFAH